MSEGQQRDLTCTRCKEAVGENETYCRNCGALFVDPLICSVHHSTPAEGVCVICAKPYCNECGGAVNNIFLCDADADCEIAEGMVRVFGSFDNVQAQYATTCLQQAGFNPFLYSRVRNPGADIVAFTAQRNYGSFPIGELKVLIPFHEALAAEKVLADVIVAERADLPQHVVDATGAVGIAVAVDVEAAILSRDRDEIGRAHV